MYLNVNYCIRKTLMRILTNVCEYRIVIITTRHTSCGQLVHNVCINVIS